MRCAVIGLNVNYYEVLHATVEAKLLLHYFSNNEKLLKNERTLK
jgi:hypothetical protein